MAEGILRSLAEERGMELEIDSAGTGDYHIGEPPDNRARANMQENGYDISDLRARQFTPEDFDRFDRIFVMDKSNYEDIMALASTETHKSKVDLFLNTSHPGENRVVPDPYFGGSDGFQHVHEMLDQAARALLIELDGENR
jgi:protein-tyrosine phosphatase